MLRPTSVEVLGGGDHGGVTWFRREHRGSKGDGEQVALPTSVVVAEFVIGGVEAIVDLLAWRVGAGPAATEHIRWSGRCSGGK